MDSVPVSVFIALKGMPNDIILHVPTVIVCGVDVAIAMS